MDLGLGSTLIAGDPRLVDHIVGEVKSQGIFDQFRKECIADVDTKPAYQNLRTRVESSVNSFLGKQLWRADLNKNQLRETLRKHIHEAPYLDAGVERIVDQVVNPKVYSVFMPQIEDVVYKFLGIERPKTYNRNGSCGLKDLLPKDLDPVSPESDKNSLRDVSLDSVDATIDDETQNEILSHSTNVEKTSADDKNSSRRYDEKNDGAKEPEKSIDDSGKCCAATQEFTTLNNSCKSDEKVVVGEEEEEDSPMFEPIDIMNLNESNISNDSHLSGISELTSHRSRSPDFSNETSRENMDFSNQDSQFSKVSSDSRLSIVTDFGSSNHASTPLSDAMKDDKDKSEVRTTKDNFKAIREFETTRTKEGRSCQEQLSCKEETSVARKLTGLRESSRDATTETSKDSRESREKCRDIDVSRSKGTKDSAREKEDRRKSRTDTRSDKVKRSKERTELSRDSGDRSRDSLKVKEVKSNESEKRENSGHGETKDLKDIYKEKIRELREKKELEKEKFVKEVRTSKETREKRDSSRDDKKESKEQKVATSKSTSRTEARTSKSESRGSTGKRDEKKSTKDHRSKSGSQGNSDSGDKIDPKRLSRTEKDDKNEKTDSKVKTSGKSSKSDQKRNSDVKRDGKNDIEPRDKKRRDDKKSKIKDDHSSLRKNYDDRRSTDRDGSNGSNGKSTQKNNSSGNATSSKSVAGSLSKESTTSTSTSTTTTTSNTSSSEISDSTDEKRNDNSDILIRTRDSQMEESTVENNHSFVDGETTIKRLDVGEAEISLPIKKRPLSNETSSSGSGGGQTIIKKPKFAKNLNEAKRLMKIRRKMEKESTKRHINTMKNDDKRETAEIDDKIVKDDLKSVPDEERVQIIEVRDEEYDEPYPEVQSDFTLEERSQIIIGAESIFTSDVIANRFNAGSTLSEMELSIRRSLNEMMVDNNQIEEGKNVAIASRYCTIGDKIEKNARDEDAASSRTIGDEGTSEFAVNSTKTIDNIERSIAKSVITKDHATDSKIIDERSVNFEKADFTKDDESEGKIELVEDRESRKNVVSMNTSLTKNACLKGETGSPEEIDENGKIVEEKSEMMVEKTEDGKKIVDETTELNENADEAGIIDKIIDDERNDVKIVEKNIENLEIHDEKSEIVKIDDDKTVLTDIIDEERKIREFIERENEPTGIMEKNGKRVETRMEKAEIHEKIVEKSKDAVNVDEKIQENEIVIDKSNNSDATRVRGKTKKETNERETNENVEESRERKSSKNDEEETCDETVRKVEAEKPLSFSHDEDDDDEDDEAPCLYFVQNNERLEKFTKFLKSLENDDESSSEEQQIEISNNEITSSVLKSMAPPKSKRKYSTSPLTDILLNNANNNNEAHKNIEPISDPEDANNIMKKRKIGRPKKQRMNAGLCGQHNLLNGENFVMPLSPESDVSATSEKIPSNPIKDDKSRPRGSNQRYASDDLYKPRPLFSSSSRRSRRSNQP